MDCHDKIPESVILLYLQLKKLSGLQTDRHNVLVHKRRLIGLSTCTSPSVSSRVKRIARAEGSVEHAVSTPSLM
ncbi:hypothetical protein E2C01_007096 [Portunus trituberculatus]|uniref:Uncharacterized protein n=1 Tax=Portunus trituberculatus TaxID=210409 RepID=A0A5B7CZJ4_PORTR|nr:hypothetical protein [Portunus trituberculatus]